MLDGGAVMVREWCWDNDRESAVMPSSRGWELAAALVLGNGGLDKVEGDEDSIGAAGSVVAGGSLLRLGWWR
ncbi:hypothetical protein V6N11_059024 [Hibiscus sabdariffa]|uniref:Uncharacterized protein n=1 Tax=Hibiscus sabdariffa TaxID=183260 RepID=A0ABR2U5Y9_9ROSI